MAAGYKLEKTTCGIRLITHRLVVRPFEPADIPALIEYLSSGDPMVERVMKIAPTPEAVEGYWGPMRRVDPFGDPEWLSLMIHVKSEGKAIGNVGYRINVINPTHKLGNIGWSVSPAYRGQGTRQKPREPSSPSSSNISAFTACMRERGEPTRGLGSSWNAWG